MVTRRSPGEVLDNCIKGCEICGGLGYIQRPAKVGDAEFGKIKQCPNRVLRFWNERSGISEFEAYTLDWTKFVQTQDVRALRKIYMKLLGVGFGWLFVYGTPGTGKTLTSKSATILAAAKYQMEAVYWRYSHLINWLRSSYDNDRGQQTYMQRIGLLESYRWLVIDEIGRDRLTDFSTQSLSEIMDRRYGVALRKAGVTIWISNFSPREVLETYCVDRVEDGRFTIYKMRGQSVRVAMQYADNEMKKGKETWWLGNV